MNLEFLCFVFLASVRLQSYGRQASWCRSLSGQRATGQQKYRDTFLAILLIRLLCLCYVFGPIARAVCLLVEAARVRLLRQCYAPARSDSGRVPSLSPPFFKKKSSFFRIHYHRQKKKITTKNLKKILSRLTSTALPTLNSYYCAE